MGDAVPCIVLLSKAARLERRAGNGRLPDERADLIAAGRFYREWYGQEETVIRSTQAHNLEQGAKHG